MTKTMQIVIDVNNGFEKGSYKANFEPVRKNKRGAILGWATLINEPCLHFPIICYPTNNKKGYVVYTVRDWQAPQSSFGDLSDKDDWDNLLATGTGHFYNCSRKNSEFASGVAHSFDL